MSLICEKRFIKLEVLENTGKEVLFKIKEQSHIRDEFSPMPIDKKYKRYDEFRVNGITVHPGRAFKSEKTGWMLGSVVYPEVKPDKKILFLRGSSVQANNDVLSISLQEFAEIQDTIDEYNEVYESKDVTDNSTVFFKTRRKNVLNKKYGCSNKHWDLYTGLSDLI